jgi:hypothetical protein
MKKIVFLVLLLASSFLKVHAQISKGTPLLTGRITYNRNTQEEKNTNPDAAIFGDQLKSTTSYFSFSPSAGLFIADNLAIGLTLGIGKQHYKSPFFTYNPEPILYTNIGEATSFSAAPFLRYYYLLKENFGFYGQLTAGYSTQWEDRKNDIPNNIPYKIRESGIYIDFTPAFIFFPTSKIGLEASMGGINYNRNRSKYENLPTGQIAPEMKRTSLSSNFGFNYLALGASYYIGRQ